jgi:hypothetical protein
MVTIRETTAPIREAMPAGIAIVRDDVPAVVKLRLWPATGFSSKKASLGLVAGAVPGVPKREVAYTEM